MNNSPQELIPVLSAMAEQAYRDGWFSLEYLTYDDLPVFLNESDRLIAETLRKIPLFITGLELLLSSPENTQLEHFLEENLTGNDTSEELLTAEFLRCVTERMTGTETGARLQQIMK